MAYFPTSPIDGASVTVNGILYTYNAAKGAWKRASSSINNLDVAGNITAAGNISAGNVSVTNKVAAGAVYTTSGLFWAGNGVAFSSFPTELDANVGTLFLGNLNTQANLGAFQTYANATFATSGGPSTTVLSANLGAFQTYANTTFSTVANAATQQTQINNIVTNANANTAAYLTTYTGNIGAGNIVTSGTSGNISGVNYIFATNYVYPNGVSILTGISGGSGTYSNTNVEAYFGANIGSLLVNAATQATSINTINANLGAFQSFSNSNAATQATSINTINANLGAFYNYANTKIGTNTNSNLVVVATTTSTSTTTGALVVGGGAGIAGNVYADKLFTSTGIFWAANNAPCMAQFTASPTAPPLPSLGSYWYKTTTDVLYEYINDGTTDYWIDIQTQTIAANTSGPSMYAGDVFGANITFTGTITGSVGYLLERANVVAGSPPATTNLDLITAPIMYFTSNTTQNITANIRGNATVTLNSMLAIGQSSTFVIFIPNATAYYVNTIKIDNVTVTPFWQGGSTVVGGNPNSIDIYTFAVLKTANATFKVFASQVRYQNLGP